MVGGLGWEMSLGHCHGERSGKPETDQAKQRKQRRIRLEVDGCKDGEKGIRI